ncbi:MAG TPA: platelet-activating factor acetylhydrolase IB subunit [Verrucomicrobiota bacterium]|nr:platelet-activating factor acetylhydrolase IB subunit [Verrucomicrobiota bacterium]
MVLLTLSAVLTGVALHCAAQNPATDPAANPAIVPVSRVGGSTNRQNLVLERARQHPGPCDVVFLGDSITQGWEGAGKNVWEQFYGRRKCLNFGVGGDRTEHVLWRLEHGQLEGLQPKAVVLMIGTNNSNNHKDGTEQYSTAQILAGVDAIINQIRARVPEARLVLLGIFPRGQTFGPQRGKLLQVNQALAKRADGHQVRYVDFGSQLIEADGSIAKEIMPDYLHLTEKGYTIWANAIEPQLQEILRAN